MAGREDVEGGSVEPEAETGAGVDADADAGLAGAETGVGFCSSPLVWAAADAPAAFMRPFSRRY